VQDRHDETRGLSNEEARQRLARFGPNELTAARRLPLLRQLFSFFANPLVIILLIASAISAFVGEPVNAAIIALVVLLSIALNFIQTSRSERAADRLRTQVAPTAKVMRDGKWTEIPRRDIVPGDVLQLSAGSLVPADSSSFGQRRSSFTRAGSSNRWRRRRWCSSSSAPQATLCAAVRASR